MRNSYKFYIFAFLVHINIKIYSTVKIYIFLINVKKIYFLCKKKLFFVGWQKLYVKIFWYECYVGKKYEQRV
jgi:hypothetical protein